MSKLAFLSDRDAELLTGGFLDLELFNDWTLNQPQVNVPVAVFGDQTNGFSYSGTGVDQSLTLQLPARTGTGSSGDRRSGRGRGRGRGQG